MVQYKMHKLAWIAMCGWKSMGDHSTLFWRYWLSKGKFNQTTTKGEHFLKSIKRNQPHSKIKKYIRIAQTIFFQQDTPWCCFLFWYTSCTQIDRVFLFCFCSQFFRLLKFDSSTCPKGHLLILTRFSWHCYFYLYCFFL